MAMRRIGAGSLGSPSALLSGWPARRKASHYRLRTSHVPPCPARGPPIRSAEKCRRVFARVALLDNRCMLLLGTASACGGLLWWSCRHSLQHASGADVFVNVGPMNTFARSDHLKVPALLRRGFRQAPG